MAEILLNNLGLKEKVVPGNGDCFFTCIVHQLMNLDPFSCESSVQVKQLRSEIVQHIIGIMYEEEIVLDSLYQKAIELGMNFIQYESNFLTKESAALSYLEKLSVDEWADIECVLAVSQLKKVHINIIRKDTGHVHSFGDDSSCQKLYLVHYFNVHYNSVEPISTNIPTSDTQTSITSIPENLFSHEKFSEVNSVSDILMQTSANIFTRNFLRIGTWNLRGASKAEKRDEVDALLTFNEIDLISVQETMSSARSFSTANYTWYLSPPSMHHRVLDNRSYHNGVGVVIRRSSTLLLERIVRVSERLLFCKVQSPLGLLPILSVHIPPNDRDSISVYVELTNFINALSDNDRKRLLVLGDMNGHIGKDVLKDPIYKETIGGYLEHIETNQRGQYLLDFSLKHKLKIVTTYGKHSAKITRASGGIISQLDHLIIPQISCFYVSKLRGVSNNLSDHKLVFGNFSPQIVSNPNPTCTSKVQRSYRKRWDVSSLRTKEVSELYKNEILSQRNQHGSVISWTDLVSILNTTCHSIFGESAKSKKSKTTAPLTPRRKKAITSLRDSIKRKTVGSCSSAEVAMKRRLLQKEFDRFRQEECRSFFSSINNFNPYERVKRTYRFIRDFRRISAPTSKEKKTFIPLSTWNQVLKESEGEFIPLICEEDHFPLLPPPTYLQIQFIVEKMSNGKAPGADNLAVELFKHMPESILSEFVYILQDIWIKNEPPKDWQQTLQFPLPKVPYPKSTADFRRITLTPVGYRIYAHFLLQLLDSILSPIGDYQAAFLNNRSADDHIFTLERVLEEEWNSGQLLYVLSLDLEKAFDKVDLNVAVTILKHLKVPHHLINRIIKCCMWERTSMIWFKQLTQVVVKSCGVKQGCPLSPRLFTLVLDSVLQTVSEVFDLPLNQIGPDIRYPLILAFADDLLVISKTTYQMSPLLPELMSVLASAGLRCNRNKSAVVIRDPLKTLPPTLDALNLGELQFSIVDSIKYLGTPISSSLQRSSTIRKRCGIALGLSNRLSLFIKENRLPRDLALQIYNTVVFPMYVHGLKVRTLTRRNRQKLRLYERMMIRNMIRYSLDNSEWKSCRILLRGRTITRRLKVMRICYWGHVSRRPPSHMLTLAKNYRLQRRKIGRPAFTYFENMKEAFSKYNLSLDDWRSLSSDKVSLKKVAETLYSDCLNDSSSDESLLHHLEQEGEYEYESDDL